MNSADDTVSHGDEWMMTDNVTDEQLTLQLGSKYRPRLQCRFHSSYSKLENIHK